MAKPHGPYQVSTPGLRICLLRNEANVLPGDWANASRELLWQRCTRAHCSERGGLVNWPALALWPKWILTLSSGIMAITKGGAEQRFERSAQTGTSSVTAAPAAKHRR